MTHTAFFDVVHQTAHASMSGAMQPTLGGKLLTHLKIIAKFFAGDQIVTVDEGTAEFLILPKNSASGTASLIDQTAELVGEGAAAQYEFEWNPAWTEQLRDALDTAADLTAPMEFRYEIHFKRGGVFGAIGGPIYFLNNFFRPDTLPPSSVSEANYAWLKRSVIAGTNVTRVDDDEAKTITFNGEGDAAALAAETAARIAADAALQSAVDGKAAASHTHPISDVTNLQSSLDAKLNADDPSVTNSRTPTGGAGGVLSGTFPNPGFAVDMATQGELDAVSAQLPAKADLVDGKIPTSQIPAIAISEFLGAVASQAAMLALTGQKGDWCNRSDTSTAWVIIGDDPTQLASWGQINYPAPLVTSVNGQAGVIVLGKADVGLGNVDNTSDANKPVSAAMQTALNGKANSSHAHSAGDITSGTLNAARLPTPGVATLGGVRRNSGGTGQFVTGIDAGGWLTFAPGGGGGAVGLHEVLVEGYTDPGTDPTGAYAEINFSEWNSTVFGSITITSDSGTITFTIDAVDPADGSIHLDSTSYESPQSMAEAMNAVLELYAAVVVSSVSGWTVSLWSNTTGDQGMLEVVSSVLSVPGTMLNSGDNGSGPSGGDQNPAFPLGLFPIRLGWTGNINDSLIEIYANDGYGELPLGYTTTANAGEIVMADVLDSWQAITANHRVYARLNDIVSGGSIRIWMVAAEL